MAETTKAQLVSAASKLLDEGGQKAVTLRAVADRVGVSHNAPYWHFKDRSALLAAVAERDFDALRAAFEDRSVDGTTAVVALRTAASALIDYGLGHPARYRLLFSDPGLEADDQLRAVAFGSFLAFSALVARAQEHGVLPAGDTAELTGLIYAALHGAIDLQLGGRSSGAKGLGSVEATASLLFKLLTPVGRGAS